MLTFRDLWVPTRAVPTAAAGLGTGPLEIVDRFIKEWLMKKLVLAMAVVTLVAAFAPTTATAQEWFLDIYGGWSYSNFSGGSSDMLGGQYRSGLGAGVGAELMLNEDWGWEFGLWYVQKGSQGTFTSNTGEGFLPEDPGYFDGKFSLDYVEVPFLVNVYFPVGEHRIRGYIGPTFAFLTRAEASGSLDGDPIDKNVSDSFDDADITVMIGIGGQFVLSRVNLLLDARYDLGATNVSNIPETEIRNTTLLITIGVGIPLASYDE